MVKEKLQNLVFQNEMFCFGFFNLTQICFFRLTYICGFRLTLTWTPMEWLGHQWCGLDTNGAAWTPMEWLGHQWSGLEQNGPLRADCLMIAYGKAEDLN
ncbi:MAG: hypothetical protein ACQGQO_10725 [Sphaerochaetaceae bacterium]